MHGSGGGSGDGSDNGEDEKESYDDRNSNLVDALSVDPELKRRISEEVNYETRKEEKL